MEFNTRFIDDPVTSDPIEYDVQYPAETFMTHFRSMGSVVHASVWTAQGPELKPTVILSSQIYGGDRLESLIMPLVNAGLNVMTFHPRGMWDGNGEYSLISGLDDVHSAVEFLRSSEAVGKRTRLGNGYRVDTGKIGVMGVSGGGGSTAVVAAAENDAIDFAIGIGVVSAEPFRTIDEWIDEGRELFERQLAESAGRINSERHLRSMTTEHIDRLSIITQAPKLVNKKLLLVGGARDTGFPLERHHIPIVNALRDAGATRLKDVTLDADHLFLQARIALARVVIAWLRSERIV